MSGNVLAQEGLGTESIYQKTTDAASIHHKVINDAGLEETTVFQKMIGNYYRRWMLANHTSNDLCMNRRLSYIQPGTAMSLLVWMENSTVSSLDHQCPDHPCDHCFLLETGIHQLRAWLKNVLLSDFKWTNRCLTGRRCYLFTSIQVIRWSLRYETETFFIQCTDKLSVQRRR